MKKSGKLVCHMLYSNNAFKFLRSSKLHGDLSQYLKRFYDGEPILTVCYGRRFTTSMFQCTVLCERYRSHSPILM
jgi:hypothetical protein